MLLDEEPEECSVDLDKNSPYENVTGENSKMNYWGKWGVEIFQQTVPFFLQEGQDINLYFLENIDISNFLLNDLQ